jgi:predicted flap endonuclease-1-like 5' DNA nuclease
MKMRTVHSLEGKMIRKPVLPVFVLVLLTGCAQDSGTSGFPWWGWLIVILLLVLIIWMLFRSQPETQLKTPSPDTEKMDIAPESVPQVEAITEEKLLPDDLTLIEGIGPKINEILHAAGVNTFAELAAMEADKINQLLIARGLRLADASSWPQQAQLAADGEMEKLQTLQDSLKGGRVV